MPERKKMSRKKFVIITSLTISMYITYVILLFWYHPFVVSAAGGTSKEESIPGGSGNHYIYDSITELSSNGTIYTTKSSANVKVKDGYELVAAVISTSGGGYRPVYYVLGVQCIDLSTHELCSLSSSNVSEFESIDEQYTDGVLKSRNVYTINDLRFPNIMYYRVGQNPDYNIVCNVSGVKIFESTDALHAYVESGSLDGMIREPVLDKDWYIKNVNMIVTADDSPTSEAGEDATYITFTWDTDNLQEGDLIEIKTHNYYKSLNGEEHGGYYDYITQANNVSAFTGKYGPFSQYEATKAWYKSLDYHPLFFKSYDTDIYFLRPIRNGKVGGWVKVFMRRNSFTKAPDVEKIEYGDFDDDNNWVTNKDLTDKEGGYGTDHFGNKVYPDMDNPFEGTNISGIFKSFFDFFKDIPSMLGGLPGLVNSTIGFLPNWVIGFIAIGIVVVIILRIVGR